MQPSKELNPSWSLGDTLADVLLLSAVARSLWRQTASFYGEAHLSLNLSVHNLELLPNSTACLWQESTPEALNRMKDLNATLCDSIVSTTEQPPTTTFATAVFNAGLPYDSDGVVEAVANVLNQLLRGLGHSADLKMLRRAVEVFLKGG